MLEIDTSGNIKINRGDTFNVPLFIDASKNIFKSSRYIIEKDDKIIFSVFEGNMRCPIITKEYTVSDTNEKGDVIISFESADTKCLFPCIYFYEIKLVRKVDEKEQIITIVPRRKFVII